MNIHKEADVYIAANLYNQTPFSLIVLTESKSRLPFYCKENDWVAKNKGGKIENQRIVNPLIERISYQGANQNNQK